MMTQGSPQRRQLIAFILSGIFPGLGQFYNGQRASGAAFAVGGGVLSWLTSRAAPTDLSTLVAPPGMELWVPLVLLLALWVWSVVDAMRAAGRRP